MDILGQTKEKMLAALEHLKNELKSIRTGRANPSMLDSVFVEIYGALMRIKDAAAINAPEARQLLITPFDSQNTNAIGKAIEKANIGLMPIVDGNTVRLKIPQMDDNVRKEMIKLCHKRCEEAKVSIRNIRRDSNEHARKMKADGNLAEDQMKKLEKNIQDLTDKSCKEADDISAKKEKEVSTI
ncbi:MAG: ribosome recycling factor [Parachlamydiaceae bacterium]|nr:ribosome recycling factor [Parachlamydiaceae bacterium]